MEQSIIKNLKLKLKESKRIEREKRKILLKKIKDQKKMEKILRKNLLREERKNTRMTKNLLKPKKYWTGEINRKAKKIREKELESSIETIHDEDEIRQYRFKNVLYSSSFESFLKSHERKVISILSNNTKVVYSILTKLEKIGKDQGNIIEYNFESDPYIILQEEDKIPQYRSLSQFFNKKLSEMEINGSGWLLKKIESMDVKIVPYVPLRGGCITCPLPRKYTDMRCIIQQDSRDGKCFSDAIHILHDYEKDKKHKHRVKSRDTEKSPFNLRDMEFPVSREDLKTFEKNNPDYLCYVLELYGKNDDKLGIYYKNTDFHHKQLEKKVLHLLFFKNHYSPII